MNQFAVRLLYLLLLLTVIGCNTVSAPPYEPQPPVQDRSEQPPPPPDLSPQAGQQPVPSAPRSDASQATLALLRESSAAKARGDSAGAIAYVERAIRLEPRRADLWIELARLQLPEKAVAAERYARKALTLAGHRADLTRQAWLVIAAAKDAKGDAAEATAIRDRFRTGRG